MKKIITIVSGLLLLFHTSCENPLDKGPLDVIGGDKVWSDETLIDAYYADLYDRARLLPTQVDNTLTQGQDMFVEINVDASARIRDMGTSYNDVQHNLNATSTSSNLQIWGADLWKYLRAINVAIQELEQSTSLDEEFRETRLGEALFLRAYTYFNLVKRYGGVPIITIPQDPSLPVKELKVSRSTEKDTYDFIAEELDKAIGLLKDKPFDKTRASVWTAYLIKSRAMLYAGSIAKNGTKLADGDKLIGIDAAESQNYYQKSVDAARMLLPAPLGSNGLFRLLEGKTTADYRKIFNSVGASTDTENIMIMSFNGLGGKWNQNDVMLLPRAGSAHPNWGAWVNVYLETVEWFDYKTGVSGELLPDGSGKLIENVGEGKYYDLEELFKDKDPRFRASIALPPFYIKGNMAYMHDQVKDEAYALSKNVPVSGTMQNHVVSAMAMYKQTNDLNPVTVNSQGTSPLSIFRLAEAYLNFMEAAFETGNTVEAQMALDIIRDRVDMPRVLVSMETIKAERDVELIFENHRYWDLRRWRCAIEPLNKQYTAVDFTYDVENEKYAIRLKKGDTKTRFFEERHYYLPIPLVEVEANDAIIQNPGYKM